MKPSNNSDDPILREDNKLNNKAHFVITLTHLLCNVEADRFEAVKKDMEELNAIINTLDQNKNA